MIDAQVGSPLARLREIREGFRADRTVDLEVPGYQGLLVARYAPVPWDILKRLAKRAEKGKANPEIEILIAADTLAHGVQGFFLREGDELTPVTYQGDEVRYDTGLATVLGVDGAANLSVRETVRSVFPDPFALVTHYGEFMTWQGEGDQEDDSELEASDELRPTRTSSRPPDSSESPSTPSG